MIRFIASVVVVSLCSLGSAAEPKIDPAVAMAWANVCPCVDCQCTPAKSCGCEQSALPAPPPAPPGTICDANGCRLASSSAPGFPTFATIAAAGQLSEFRSVRRGPVRGLFAALRERVASRRSCN